MALREGEKGGGKVVPVSFYLPQIPYGIFWEGTRSCMVRGPQLDIRAITENKVVSLQYLNSCELRLCLSYLTKLW